MKQNIAITAGGDSGEYSISMKSARMVANHIDKTKYQVYIIEIKGSNWNYLSGENKNIPVDKNDFSLTINGEKINFDLVFNMIHGSPGENGKLQGYLDMLALPYTTGNAISSALTFNKAYCNQIVKGSGIAVANHVHLFKKRKFDIDDLMKRIKLPAFVKPNQGGSSVGMTKVNHLNELDAAINKAFAEDDEILIEEFIKGREMTCGVFEYRSEIIPMPITEIISKKDFFDYEAKYDHMADEITPAAISVEQQTHIHETASKLYIILNCSGIVRFDFILTDEDLWFLEVNTVPGMSNASIVPQQVQVMGYSLKEFYSMLIEEALRNG